MPVKNRHRFFYSTITGKPMSTQQELREVYVEKEPWWITATKQLGLPTVLLVLLGIGIYNASVWLGSNVLRPLTERQIEFINQVDVSVKKITTIVEEHQKNNGLIARELEAINNGIEKLNVSSNENGKKLEKIEASLNHNN
jgi:hypothetical protein